MSAEDFYLEEVSEILVRLRHREGHRYTFAVIVLPDGRKGLSRGVSLDENGRAKHSAAYFHKDASEVAWTVALAAGILDKTL